MTIDATFNANFAQGQDTVQQSVTITADDKGYSLLDVAAGATVNFLIGTDPDAVKGYAILPTFGGTLTTTNSTGAADVITLVANQPLLWHALMGLTDSRFANRNPWTQWAFHNTDAAAGTVKILIMRDGTP